MIKLLLVDDETTTRKGLLKHIPWLQLGVDVVEEAKDAFEAIETASKIEPQILLSDIRMPGMNGIELAKKIRDHFPDCIIIFLSGYSDKEYLKEAISLRAVSYVEKPINLTEVKATIAKAVELCQAEEKKRLVEETANIAVNENLSIMKQKIVMSLIHQRDNDSDILKKLKLLNIKFGERDQFNVALIKIRSFADYDKEDPLANEKFLELISEALYGVEHIASFKDNNHIIVVSALGVNEYQSVMAKLFDSLKYGDLENRGDNIKLFFAVGQVVNGIREIPEAYVNAVVTLQKLFFHGYNKIIFYESAKENTYKLDETLQERFSQCLSGQRVEEAISIIEGLYYDIRKRDNILVNTVKDIFFKLVFQLLMEADKRGVFFSEGEENEEKYLWDSISNFQTLEEIKDYIINKINLVFRRIEELEGSSRTIFGVKRHIEKNFGDENLSTKTLAEMVYLTPAYLSGLFRKETGKTISEYILEVRMEKSKSFLKDTRLKLFEVALNVGYNDPNYYAKIFKKYTGLTPSEYREKYLS